ncbi:MAG: helix-turn-helix domain-containing protein [Aequorivita sp.]|nr:helix-turn-helix domain-containing protein [Aequorivita sp.]
MQHTTTLSTFLNILQLFVSVLFYFSICYFTNPHKQFRGKDYLHLVIPTVVSVSVFFKTEFVSGYSWRQLFVVTMLLQALFYTTLSYILLEKHQKRLELFNSERESVDLKWIKHIIIALIGISVFISIYNILFIEGSLNSIANSLTLVIIYFIAYHAMRQKEIFIIGKEDMEYILQDEEYNAQVKNKLISNDELAQIKQRVIEVMECEKPYLEGNLSLTKLAELITVSPHQLSYVLNEGFQKNFFQFINDYRVEKAKAYLVSSEYDHLSILGIAYESGFNSKTAFNTVFKKHTGKTPTVFKNERSIL